MAILLALCYLADLRLYLSINAFGRGRVGDLRSFAHFLC
jgi:hypothetical protein